MTGRREGLGASELLFQFVWLILTLWLLSAACLLVALLLRVVARWIAKLQVPYNRAFAAVFLPNALTLLLAALLSLALTDQGQRGQVIILATMPPVGLLLQTLAIRQRLQVPFHRAVWISLATLALVLLFVLPIVLYQLYL